MQTRQIAEIAELLLNSEGDPKLLVRLSSQCPAWNAEIEALDTYDRILDTYDRIEDMLRLDQLKL